MPVRVGLNNFKDQDGSKHESIYLPNHKLVTNPNLLASSHLTYPPTDPPPPRRPGGPLARGHVNYIFCQQLTHTIHCKTTIIRVTRMAEGIAPAVG
jgi:hypothetical protein